MVDPITWRRFWYRCLFFLVCSLVIFGSLLPLSTVPESVPGPDLVFCLTAAFLMRRPRWAPVVLIVFIHLLSDILFLRPLGLWTAISLVAYEFLRAQTNATNELPVPLEVAFVTGAFAAATVVNGLFHLVFAISHPGIGVTFLHILTTAVAYPFVVALAHFVLRVRRARASELDSTGVIG